MSFVIDSLEWDFTGKDVSSVSCLLEQLLDRVCTANERGERVYIGKDLQSRSVCNDMDLWSFLYSEQMMDLDGAILNELSAVLNRLESYEDDDSIWPSNFLSSPVVDEDGVDVGLDIEFVHFTNLSNTPMACLSLYAKGAKSTRSRHGSVDVQLINDEVSHKDFWRITALRMLRDTPANLEKLSCSMYPNLWFTEEVWAGISNFQGGYPRAAHKLKQLLTCLDDYGTWIFTEPPPALSPEDSVVTQTGGSPSNEIIERRFTRCGVEMAPEKPNVRQDTDCFEARVVEFKPSPTSDRTLSLYCEWHGKLERHTNRVHIHPPIAESEGKVIVAIFHKHLPLP